jgi:hypothetical protein
MMLLASINTMASHRWQRGGIVLVVVEHKYVVNSNQIIIRWGSMLTSKQAATKVRRGDSSRLLFGWLWSQHFFSYLSSSCLQNKLRRMRCDGVFKVLLLGGGLWFSCDQKNNQRRGIISAYYSYYLILPICWLVVRYLRFQYRAAGYHFSWRSYWNNLQVGNYFILYILTCVW